ncbi:hypothetical protein EAF04_006796 [Stromatinia cepivora]|nr:hypothetical protein EAF04_006796 [Stromatinia cepivora]
MASFTLKRIASDFRNYLESTRPKSQSRPVVIIAQSHGGLVVKMALGSKSHSATSTTSTIDSVISGIIFFTSPYWDTHYGDIYSRDIQLQATKEDGKELEQAQFDFLTLVNTRLLDVHFFYENMESYNMGEDKSSSPITAFPVTDPLGELGKSNALEILVGVTRKFIRRASYMGKAREDRQRELPPPPSMSGFRAHGDYLGKSPPVTKSISTESQHFLQLLASSFDDTNQIVFGDCVGKITDTFSWLLGDLKFTAWLHNPLSSLLWIHGGPGTGKTYATRFLIYQLTLIQELQNKRDIINNKTIGESKPKANLLAYFFCNRLFRQPSAINIIQCLLCQLLKQRPDLIDDLKVRFDLSNISHPDTKLATWWKVFEGALQYMDSTFVLIDGLDEGDESIEGLINLLMPYIHPQGKKSVISLSSNRESMDIRNSESTSNNIVDLTVLTLPFSLFYFKIFL